MYHVLFSRFTSVVQDVLRKGQQGGEHAADAQAQHASPDEEKDRAFIEDQQQELHHDDPQLRETHTGTDRRSERRPVTITEFTEVTEEKTSFHCCASVTMSRNIQIITNQHFIFYFKKEIAF